jgi:16S rRNA C967 or C1407 C5-methylase (RsmB/RsmF family)
MAILRSENIAFERIKNLPHAFKIKNRSDKELLEHYLTREGKVYLQGIASMLPVLVLDPKPGEKILDMCAAPGSKTTQIATIISNLQPPTSHLQSCDNNEIRFQKLQNTLRIQGAKFVEARHCDASLLHKELPKHFDKILVDAPCSAEGRIDLNDPRSFSFWNEKNITAHAKLQRRLLRSAVACLKPGGTLIYSTCTLSPEENELMIKWLLENYPELKNESFELPFVLTRQSSTGGVYVLPTKDNEGLFVAKIRKTQTIEPPKASDNIATASSASAVGGTKTA